MNLDAAHPLQLTVEYLAKASPLAKVRGAFWSILTSPSVSKEPPHQDHFGCPENSQPSGLPTLGYSWYSAIGSLADDSHFFVAFDPVTDSIISAGICK